MKKNKCFRAVFAAALLALCFGGCETPNGGGVDTAHITYNVMADGSITETTSALTFTFSAWLNKLSAEDIIISGTGVTKGEITGRGARWTLTLTVTTAENITVSIAKDRVESEKKPVTVYKEGEPAPPIGYTVAANGDESATTNALTFTFSAGVTGLTAEDITVSGTGVTRGNLTGSGTRRILRLTVTTGGTISVSINKEGIDSVPKQLTVYKTTITYTVTFNADGGSPATVTRTVESSGTVGSDMPSDPTRSGYSFGGWYTAQNGGGGQFTGSTVVSANITVYAKWAAIIQVPSDLSLTEALEWIESNAAQGMEYAITLKEDEAVEAPLQTLSYSVRGVTVTLKGGNSMRTLTLYAPGSLFTVGSGLTLKLGINVTLQGYANNNVALVNVLSGGTLLMSANSKITGNTLGGGVTVGTNGVFKMSDGEISGNSSSIGGGVHNLGTFTMSGNAKVSGNTASSGGGGVHNSGTFTMSGYAEISGNTASSGGGLYNLSTFTMSGYAEISGNTASSGGGVCALSSSQFTMEGGTISGNTASTGGGVYVNGGTFTKSGQSTIYGDTDTTHTAGNTENTALSGDGHAVYVYFNRKRNSTAGPDVNLDSTKTGTTGGWES
ncbi:MAG: InlB B-repeat-containing protein [Spirochaetaceae bacterium]|jgi:uncharacterized repeat protein (TIGR02543 family)|nr:InlB B-repeat-containing protein [Spirochaetaceae bacterium]